MASESKRSESRRVDRQMAKAVHLISLGATQSEACRAAKLPQGTFYKRYRRAMQTRTIETGT